MRFEQEVEESEVNPVCLLPESGRHIDASVQSRPPTDHCRHRIGIFSKLHMAGGSERRCVEMANALVRYAGIEARLLCEGELSSRLTGLIDSRVVVRRRWLAETSDLPTEIDQLDALLVVNTDSREFCTRDYWEGRTGRPGAAVDLGRVRRMVFLFNYLVSPSRHLASIAEICPRLGIITANRKFFDEIDDQDRYGAVRHWPRMILESPINPDSVSSFKTPSPRVRLGCHGTSNADKWNRDWRELIAQVNSLCGIDRIAWRFLGMPSELAESLREVPNVSAFPVWSLPVKGFLEQLDICVSFPSWRREEPWSRSTAEALLSGCPLLTTPRGGNRDQVVEGENGFLCRSLEEFVQRAADLVHYPELRARMSREAAQRAESFTSSEVIHRFLKFIGYEGSDDLSS